MFFVIIYSAIDQGYIGLSLASCHKDEIWDLWAELGLILDHFSALVPIGTKSQIWDIITSTVLVIWIFSFPRPNFPKLRPGLFSETKFFWNRNRDFFPKPNFPKPSKIWQKFRNREVSKPKCQSLMSGDWTGWYPLVCYDHYSTYSAKNTIGDWGSVTT